MLKPVLDRSPATFVVQLWIEEETMKNRTMGCSLG